MSTLSSKANFLELKDNVLSMELFVFVPKTRQEVANFEHACARSPLQRTAQPENILFL